VNLRRFLEENPDFEVCGEAVDGVDAVEKATRLAPDLVILDLAMPRMNGLEAAHQIKSMPSHTPVILFTMHSEALQFLNVADAGIDAVVTKTNLAALKQNIDNLLAEDPSGD